MGKQLKKIAKYSMTAVLATSALVPSAVAFAADEKPVAKDVTHIVVENENGLVKLNLEDYGTALALGIMKDTDVKYVVADNGEIFSLEDYGTALALSDNAKEKALEVLAKDSLQQDVKVKEGTISEDGKAVTDETPSEIAVESVKAINETTVEVTLPEGFKATEADLVGKTITVKAGDKTLTATYSEKSLDKEGKAVFTLADGEKLEDAVEYTASADWAEFTDATFVAKTAEAHVAEFVKVTEKVASNVKEDGTKDKDVQIAFAAKDQYGEEISLDKATALSVTGTVNGMPLKANEIKLTGEDAAKKTSPVVVDFALKEGDTLEFTVVDTKDKKKVAETTFTYEVAKAEKAVVSSIELKTTDNKTSAPSGEKIEFEATAYDQFKSPDANAKLRWVVNGKEVAADQDTLNKFTLTETTPGEYKVQVFSTDNTKVKAEKTVTIGAADLKTLELKPEVTLKDEDVKVTETDKRFNKEELVIGTLTPNEGAALVASNVKFHVTTSDKNLTKDDIKVTATEAETKDGKKVIVVKATTTKAGSFQVTPFVGEEFTADKTVKASVSTTIATKVNAEIATIEDITFDAKDLKAGTPVKKAIEFKNKHGEVLTADQVNTSLKLTSSNDTVLQNNNVKVEQGKKDVEGEDVNKTYITFTSEKEAKGTTVLTIQAGAVVKTHTLNFVGATLTKIDAGSKVTGVVAGDTADKAKYNEINFLDQDGKKMAPQTAEVTVTDAKGSKVDAGQLVKLGKLTGEGKDAKFAPVNGDKTVTHAQILATDKVAQGTYNVTVTSKVKDTNGKDVEVKGSFQVVVDAARAAKTVEVTAKAPIVTVAGTTTLTIVPKDQYGEFIAVTPEVKGDEFVTEGKVTAIDKEGKVTTIYKDIVAYQVTVTGAKKGTGTVKVDVKDTKGAVLATGSQSIKVDSVGNVIESVEIEEVKEVQSTNKAEATVELKATGKDAAGNDVAIADADLTWSIKSVKDADGKEVKLNAQGQVLDKDGKVVAGKTVKIDENGKLTVSEGLTVEVEAEVTSANQKKATTVVKFEGADAVYTKDLAVQSVKFGGATEATDAKDLEDKGLKLTFGKDSINKESNSAEITVTFTGVDQYGKPYDFKDAKELTVSTEDRTVATAKAGAKGAVTLTVAELAQEGDKTFINVTAGKDTVKLEVTVSKEVADLVAAKQAYDKAVAAFNKATAANSDNLNTAVETAKTKLAEAEKAAGTDEQKQAVETAKTKLAEAEKAVEDAKVSIAEGGELAEAVKTAQAELDKAEAAVEADETGDTDGKLAQAVTDAEAKLAQAEKAVTDTKALIAEGGDLAEAVKTAQAELDKAEAAVKPTEEQAKAIAKAEVDLKVATEAKAKAEADLKVATEAKTKAEAALTAAGGTIS